jgi:beta-phosphoglucomutase-like phosphatase (HAD superfamily)
MTKHRPDFAAAVKPTPDAETLVAFIRRAGFIIATVTTRPMLDVLERTGLLEVKLIGRGKGREKMRRYVMKGKAE